MKKTILKVVFIFIIWGVGIWIVSNIASCGRSKQDKEKVETEKKIQTERLIAGMVARHNAVTDWNKNLEKKADELKDLYTIEVEEALIRSDGRPVLFFSSVDDIIREKNKHFVHFSKWLGLLSPDIRFVLECDSDQVKKILSQTERGFLAEYAVVAVVSSIQRPKFDVKAQSMDSGEPGIVVEYSDIFIAQGRCLELLYVGFYDIVKD